MDTREWIRESLQRRKRKAIADPYLAPAAVLVPLFQREGEYHLLFTKRTSKVEYHKGQISFPGGAFDRGDESLLTTALRESYEEIGLRAEDVEVLGELDDIITATSNFRVTPFVGSIPYPYLFKPYQEEVERLIQVPLSALRRPQCLGDELLARALEGPGTGEYYCYEGDVIWGATARILSQFLELTGSKDFGRRETLQYRS